MNKTKLESWEYTYEYVIRNGNLIVAPIHLECIDCEYSTWVGRDINLHQREHGHFYKMQVAVELAEEWNPHKHPAIPLTLVKTLPDSFKNKFLKSSA